MKHLPYILMVLALCAVTAGLWASPGAMRVRDRVALSAAGGRLPAGPSLAPIPVMYEPIGRGVDVGDATNVVQLPDGLGAFDFEHVEKSDPLLAGVYFDGEPAKLKPPKLNRWSRISLEELRQKVWLSWGN